MKSTLTVSHLRRFVARARFDLSELQSALPLDIKITNSGLCTSWKLKRDKAGGESAHEPCESAITP